MRTTALERLLATAKQATSQRLQSRSIGAGAAPEFTRKAKLRDAPSGRRPANDAKMLEIGEERVRGLSTG
jgi:hypothetical protein